MSFMIFIPQLLYYGLLKFFGSTPLWFILFSYLFIILNITINIFNLQQCSLNNTNLVSILCNQLLYISVTPPLYCYHRYIFIYCVLI